MVQILKTNNNILKNWIFFLTTRFVNFGSNFELIRTSKTRYQNSSFRTRTKFGPMPKHNVTGRRFLPAQYHLSCSCPPLSPRTWPPRFACSPGDPGRGRSLRPPQQEAGSERRRKWPSQLNKNVIYDFIVCGVPRMNLVVVIRWVQWRVCNLCHLEHHRILREIVFLFLFSNLPESSTWKYRPWERDDWRGSSLQLKVVRFTPNWKFPSCSRRKSFIQI